MSKKGLGYTHIHTAIDAYSRLAYSEFAGIENTANCVAFLHRAVAWFATHRVTIERVMTDNAHNYRTSRAFQQALSDNGVRHLRTRPYRPQTNGKAERFNQTLLNEWAYDQPYQSNQERLDSFTVWLHDYNWHRLHTEVGAAPASRLPINNVCMNDT